eukprot:EG_transcript_20747
MTRQLASAAVEAAACAEAVVRSGYRVVAFDMDQTLVCRHSQGRLRCGDVPAYVAAASPDAVALILELHARGIRLAIATHSDTAEYGKTRDAVTGAPTSPETHRLGDDLASAVLQALFPPALAAAVHVVAFNPGARGVTDAADNYKRYHVRRIAEHFGVPPTAVLLFDDDEDNCQHTEEGFSACRVLPERGFRFQDLRPAPAKAYAFERGI